MSKKKKKSFGAKQGKPPVGDINVTPLIDVVLVLLIIYMVVTPIMMNRMSINLPEKTETVPQENLPKEQILVAACEDGQYSLNRVILPLRELTDKVRKKIIRKRAAGEKGLVFVDGHPETDYSTMVKLMDAVRDAGNQANISVEIGLASLKAGDDFSACTPIEVSPTPAPPDTPSPVEGG